MGKMRKGREGETRSIWGEDGGCSLQQPRDQVAITSRESDECLAGVKANTNVQSKNCGERWHDWANRGKGFGKGCGRGSIGPWDEQEMVTTHRRIAKMSRGLSPLGGGFVDRHQTTRGDVRA